PRRMNGRTGSRAIALRGLRYAPAPQGDGEIEGAQIEAMASRSRGRFCPSFAVDRRPMEAKGRREGRAPAGTRDPCAAKMHTGWTTGVPVARPSLRGWF